MNLKNLLRKATGTKPELPADFEDLHRRIVAKVKPFTMTTPERIYSLIEGIRYIHRHNIPGDIVECGTWKGGSMLAVAETLMALQDDRRTLYLYDTFEGMPAPDSIDENCRGEKASDLMVQEEKDTSLVWAYSTLDTVKRTMSQSRYTPSRIKYVEGKVEDTIPAVMPEKIALLRLDTDWYSSTRHELEHLYPRLSKGGVLIIDDYGFWKGARKAVDEYFEGQQIPVFLSRVDDTCRLAIKQ